LVQARTGSSIKAPPIGRSFWLLWTAGLSSGLGDGVVLVAFPLLAARLTDNAQLISGVSAAAALPWLIAGLPAGALADRMDRRRLMFSIELFRAMMLTILAISAWAGVRSLLMLYLTVFAIGLGQTAFGAASGAELPRLVADEHLGRANGYLSAAEITSESTVGPAIGGVLFGLAIAAPFALDGLSFAVSAVLIAAAIPRRPAPTEPAVRRPLSADLREGWRHFVADELLVLLATMIALLAFCQALVLSTLVLTALHTFGLGSSGYGLLLGCTAVGSVVGGVVAGRVDQRLGPALTLSLGAAIAGGSYAIVGFTTNWAAAAVGLTLEGVAVMLGNVSSMTLRQRRVPGHLLGRVGNIMRLCIFGVTPLGALAGGALAANVSLAAPFLVAAVVQLVAVAMFAPVLGRRCEQMAWSRAKTEPTIAN
jgi:MFS family permease